MPNYTHSDSLPLPPPQVYNLYTAPFKDDGMSIYIFDANNNVVADFATPRGKKWDEANTAFRVRGWGRTQYFDDGEALQDLCEEYFPTLVTGVERDFSECLNRLNVAWAMYKNKSEETTSAS